MHSDCSRVSSALVSVLENNIHNTYRKHVYIKQTAAAGAALQRLRVGGEANKLAVCDLNGTPHPIRTLSHSETPILRARWNWFGWNTDQI